MDINQFYHEAKNHVITAGYKWEIDLVFSRTWEQAQPDNFFAAYCFVVFNAGVNHPRIQIGGMSCEGHGQQVDKEA